MKQKTENKKGGTEKTCYMLRDTCYVSQGFTFIETLVAISILLLAITSPLTLASQGLTASRIARDSTIATYLAQEGIEYVRNVRDTNVLSGDDWLAGIDATCIDDGVCELDVAQGSLAGCAGKDTCAGLMYNEDTGIYGLDTGEGWEETNFSRRLWITTTNPGTEVLVSVGITWQDGIRERELKLEESLFNWP